MVRLRIFTQQMDCEIQCNSSHGATATSKLNPTEGIKREKQIAGAVTPYEQPFTASTSMHKNVFVVAGFLF